MKRKREEFRWKEGRIEEEEEEGVNCRADEDCIHPPSEYKGPSFSDSKLSMRYCIYTVYYSILTNNMDS